jgi:hypothetical protein
MGFTAMVNGGTRPTDRARTFPVVGCIENGQHPTIWPRSRRQCRLSAFPSAQHSGGVDRMRTCHAFVADSLLNCYTTVSSLFEKRHQLDLSRRFLQFQSARPGLRFPRRGFWSSTMAKGLECREASRDLRPTSVRLLPRRERSLEDNLLRRSGRACSFKTFAQEHSKDTWLRYTACVVQSRALVEGRCSVDPYRERLPGSAVLVAVSAGRESPQTHCAEYMAVRPMERLWRDKAPVIPMADA